MPPTPPAPDLPTLTPAEFAARFTLIVTALVALIARGLLRHPTYVSLIVPLYRRLNRNARYLTTIMARLAAGKPTAPRSRKASRRQHLAPQAPTRPPEPPIPTTKAWLVHALKHEAAAYRCQLAYLLAEPGMSDLLDAAPTARRLLNPICRMLGLPTHALPRRNEASAPATATPLCTPAAEATPLPTPAIPLRWQNWAPRKHPLPDPPPPGRRPPPCPHLALRWPWLPHPSAKPA